MSGCKNLRWVRFMVGPSPIVEEDKKKYVVNRYTILPTTIIGWCKPSQNGYWVYHFTQLRFLPASRISMRIVVIYTLPEFASNCIHLVWISWCLFLSPRLQLTYLAFRMSVHEFLILSYLLCCCLSCEVWIWYAALLQTVSGSHQGRFLPWFARWVVLVSRDIETFIKCCSASTKHSIISTYFYHVCSHFIMELTDLYNWLRWLRSPHNLDKWWVDNELTVESLHGTSLVNFSHWPSRICIQLWIFHICFIITVDIALYIIYYIILPFDTMCNPATKWNAF